MSNHSQWWNLLRPPEAALAALFPLAGFWLNHGGGIPPFFLAGTAVLFGFGLVVDNGIEGYLFHEKDAVGGDYPVHLFSSHLEWARNLRTLFYVSFLLLSFLNGGTVFAAGAVSYFCARLYNDHRVSAKAHPPLGLICHFLGGFSFFLYGGFWDGLILPPITLPGLALSAICSGGYLNHLDLDRDRDFHQGISTLAHRFSKKVLAWMACSFIVAGDGLLAFWFFPQRIGMSWIMVATGVFVLAARILLVSPRSFRTLYRAIHGVSLAGLMVLLWV
ncbi:MAG TPA: hypothetical protein PK014_10170 [Thermoanaerobaculia bacterium]|nr:hypothetical protein [Thermoanaerobaculia bacterium]HUM30484.1 hypothetical protein [Thermoanaerobaculia bacterium]HXK68649.1 hypothetical protein [Thermoanaerobaculia bacterium]